MQLCRGVCVLLYACIFVCPSTRGHRGGTHRRQGNLRTQTEIGGLVWQNHLSYETSREGTTPRRE